MTIFLKYLINFKHSAPQVLHLQALTWKPAKAKT